MRRGAAQGVRLLDVNRDGYMDVLLGDTQQPKMRIWHQVTKRGATWRRRRSPGNTHNLA